MKQLIEALQIFSKYLTNDDYVTHCEHDTFYVNINESKVSDEDKIRLKELGFIVNNNIFASYRHGSC